MNRQVETPEQQQTGQIEITRLQIGLVAVIAIIMVLAFIVFNQRAGGEEPAETASSNLAVGQQGTFAGINLGNVPSGLTGEGDPALGTPNAPVTIVEYSDYQCPHCASFSQNTLPAVVKNYVATGQVRHVHRNAVILGEESLWAAQAAHCAADQGRFWEYHELLFQKQSGRNQGAFSRDNLKQFAADLGLETAAFNQCLDQNKYSQKVIEQTQAAQQLGVRGTPSFFVNDEFIEGNIPFSAMKDIIEKHLGGSS